MELSFRVETDGGRRLKSKQEVRSTSQSLELQVVGSEDQTNGLRLSCLSSLEPRNERGISG